MLGSQSESPSNLRYPTPPARVPLATVPDLGTAFLMAFFSTFLGDAGVVFLATCLVPNLGRLNFAVTLTGMMYQVEGILVNCELCRGRLVKGGRCVCNMNG